MELKKIYRFEASHILPKHPGKCSRLHGHSWVLHVAVRGPVNRETGFVMDFGDISKVVKPIVESLDHRHLGTWELIGRPTGDPINEWSVKTLPWGFYPTSENLLIWLAGQLKDLPLWSSIAIEETCTSYAILTREEYESSKGGCK